MPRRTYFRETETKTLLRKKISSQYSQWIEDKPKSIVCSLPGRRWEMETDVLFSAFKKGHNLSLHCFERHAWMKKYMPKHFKETIQFTQKYDAALKLPGFTWNKPIQKVYANYGPQKGLFTFPYEQQTPCFTWADYCGTPLATHVIEFEKAIKKGDVIYVTFYLIPRFIESIDSECYKALVLPVEKRARALTKILETIIRRQVGDDFTRIGYGFYTNGAGHRGASPMLTVGWHFQKDSPLK